MLYRKKPIPAPTRLGPQTGLRTLRTRKQQHGIALVMSLVFLLLLTIIAVTATNTSTLQEKMAGNMRDLDLALQAAETALKGSHQNIKSIYTTKGRPLPDTTASNGVYSPLTLTATQLDDNSWWSSMATNWGGSGNQLPSVSSDPEFVTEEMSKRNDHNVIEGPVPGPYVYRTTARGKGSTEVSRTILQDTFQARPPGF